MSESFVSSDINPKWRERFEFFEQYGPPSSSEFRAAFRKLPYGKKLLININWFGLFFGPFYWLAIGMWRRALTWFGMAIAIGLVLGLLYGLMRAEFLAALDRGSIIALNLLGAMSTNYSYYLKAMKGDNGWNPYKGMRWF
jgi:hypothetical protein